MNKYQEALDNLCNKMFCGVECVNSGVCSLLKPLQELVDKATPKKLVRYDFSKEWHCPNCGSGNGEYAGTVGTHNYCHFCGQALDWSGEDEK